MNFESPVAAALNHLLEAESWARERLAPFAGETLELREPIDGGPSRLLLIGMGAPEKLTRSAAHRNLMTAVRRITCKQFVHVAAVPPAESRMRTLKSVRSTSLSPG